MNVVVLTGRLTRDPEIRYTQGQNSMAVAHFTVAVDRRGRKTNDPNGQTADFPRCTAFGKTAEFMEKYFHQGSRISVRGRIQTGQYTDRNGQTVYTTDVICDDVEFGETKAEADQRAANAPQNQGPNQGQMDNGYDPNGAAGDDFMNVPDDEEGLPFN